MVLSRHDDARFSWNDYQKFPKEERWEIIQGEAFAMTPAPSTRHQAVSGELFAALHAFFGGTTCKAFAAPTDVRLSEIDIVQPDILVVCDKEQIRETHIEGPPRLVIEILSPSSCIYDRGRKLDLYARSGIAELWLVSTYPSLVEVLVLDGDSYRVRHAYAREQTLQSPSFPDLEIDLAQVFDFPIDPNEEIVLIKESRPVYG